MTELLFQEKIQNALNERKNKGNYRTLKAVGKFTDFFSNDYLGLSALKNECKNTFYSPGSSRLIAGTTSAHLSVEEYLAHHFEGEAALLFNSGYVANLAVFSTLAKKGDIVLYDEHIHASIKDGIRLSFAQGIKFKHNDIKDLERLLTHHCGKNIFVAIEALYSMEGVKSPLKEMIDLCQQYQAKLILDEAHSGGTYGENGKGLSATLKNNDLIFLRVFTFGKAFGSHGACVITSELVKDYLINFARPFIYTTAMPRFMVEDILLKVSSSTIHERQKRLEENIHFFINQFPKGFLKSDVNSPIQTVYFKSMDVFRKIENKSLTENLGVKAIYAPTVQEDKERLRISIHAHNTKKELQKLSDLIKTID